MKLIIASVAALSFTIGCITGQATKPTDSSERERADRLQKEYWWAMGQREKYFDLATKK